MREAVRTRSALKLETPTALVRPCNWQSARPCSSSEAAFGARDVEILTTSKFEILLSVDG